MVTQGAGRERRRTIERRATHPNRHRVLVGTRAAFAIAITAASAIAIALAAMAVGGRSPSIGGLMVVMPRLIAVAFILVGGSAMAFAAVFALGRVDVAEKATRHDD